MEKIDELIKEICTEGVEFKLVGEIVNVISAPKKLNKTEYLDSGKIPIIDQGQKFIVAYTNNENAALEKNEYVIFGEHTREIKFVDFSFAQGADGVKILLPKKEILPKFLYYSLRNLNIPSRGYNRHWSILKEMKIAVPPLEIQSKITSILDDLTLLSAKLSAELEAELEARQKQYEYYRNKLLTFKELVNEG